MRILLTFSFLLFSNLGLSNPITMQEHMLAIDNILFTWAKNGPMFIDTKDAQEVANHMFAIEAGLYTGNDPEHDKWDEFAELTREAKNYLRKQSYANTSYVKILERIDENYQTIRDLEASESKASRLQDFARLLKTYKLMLLSGGVSLKIEFEVFINRYYFYTSAYKKWKLEEKE